MKIVMRLSFGSRPRITPNATPQAIWFGERYCDRIARIRFGFLLIRENMFLLTLRVLGSWVKANQRLVAKWTPSNSVLRVIGKNGSKVESNRATLPNLRISQASVSLGCCGQTVLAAILVGETHVLWNWVVDGRNDFRTNASD